ncbi:MAG: 3-oxoacyl-ACP reductase, partial [Rhodospirillaceae bacterium]
TARADQLLKANAETQGISEAEVLSGLVSTVADIADAVCFLVSERATYVNGSALVIDGSESLVI